MTRRVARLVAEGLVSRSARCRRRVESCVTLTVPARAADRDAPVHHAHRELFVAQLDDQELAALEAALRRSPSTAPSAERRQRQPAPGAPAGSPVPADAELAQGGQLLSSLEPSAMSSHPVSEPK